MNIRKGKKGKKSKKLLQKQINKDLLQLKRADSDGSFEGNGNDMQ